MSEWLTTGQMIDRLKAGEIAECVNAPDGTLSSKRVIINEDGNLQYLNGYGFRITEFVKTEAKWRIIPNYVKFEEALKALRDGKVITIVDDNEMYSYRLNPDSGVEIKNCQIEKAVFKPVDQYSGIKWSAMIESKWIIED
jgi:hypothetical protein